MLEEALLSVSLGVLRTAWMYGKQWKLSRVVREVCKGGVREGEMGGRSLVLVGGLRDSGLR